MKFHKRKSELWRCSIFVVVGILIVKFSGIAAEEDKLPASTAVGKNIVNERIETYKASKDLICFDKDYIRNVAKIIDIHNNCLYPETYNLNGKFIFFKKIYTENI